METRKPILSAIASIFFPGLGQLYNGKIYRAIIFHIIFILLGILLVHIFLGVFVFALIFILLSIGFYIYCIIDSVKLSNKNANYHITKVNRWYWYVAFIIISIVFNWFYSDNLNGFERYYPSVIRTRAMRPNFELNDRVIIDRFYYNYHDLEVNDIVTYIPPGDESLTLKRVVAHEGDIVEIKNYQLFVNGEIQNNVDILTFDEEYFSEIEYFLEPLKLQLLEDPTNPVLINRIEEFNQPIKNNKDFGPYIVPEYRIFVLGDNRYNSADSRTYEAIELKTIEGKVIYKFYPKIAIDL